MKKYIAILCLLSFSMIACDKDNDDIKESLSGTYTETFPVNGRTQLTFPGNNTLIISRSDSESYDQFSFELTGDKIILTPIEDSSISTEHEFEMLSASKIRVGNLYPRIPENPPVLMVFEKL